MAARGLQRLDAQDHERWRLGCKNWLTPCMRETSAVGHTKIPLFFPNMDISIAIREDVRKNASVKKSGNFVKYSRCNSTFKF